MVVLVALILLIYKIELLVVDKIFNFVNILVDVAFKLFIDNVELVDKEFRLSNIVVE